jgi:hypothetical protein
MQNQKVPLMNHKFEKALLLCPSTYSIFNSLISVLKELAFEASGFDLRESIGKADLRINTHIFRLPYHLRLKWENYFFKKTNQILIKKFQSENPDLVLIYNSEYILPETCKRISKKAKLVFFMGDSPFYTPLNNSYLACLEYADLILVPDTFWIEQLKTLGIFKTAFFIPGMDLKSYYSITEHGLLDEIIETEVFYTGTSYVNSWGYKKALLMNQFTRFNFKLYGGNTWNRWFSLFPELESHFVCSGYIPTDLLNRMFNKTKLIPVDGNPGILNGFHLRLFESLGSGALPLVEYRRDVKELLFHDSGLMVPLIEDYRKAADIADYFLKNEKERIELARELKNFILKRYSPIINAEYIFSMIDHFSKNS